jgi:UDP-N-acetylmuramoylalanine--D-glutamate ligase
LDAIDPAANGRETMRVDGKQVVVMGLARSGIAAARFLSGNGARVTVTDQAGEDDLGAFAEEARQLGVALELGGHRRKTLETADLIVISPGVPHTLAPLASAREKGIPVIGEVELASRFIDTPIVAVTGTNGKTTTTELLGRMLAASGRKVFVGGNIGNPLIRVLQQKADLDVIVAEISSFQLDTILTFRPKVAVLLNISPDHLDRYPDLPAYAASKRRIFMNQRPSDYAVCNGNDTLAQQQIRAAAGRVLNFFVRPPENGQPAQGAIVTPRQIAVVIPGLANGRINLDKTALIGPHNRENIAAAALAAIAAGGTLQGIQEALDGFQVLAHRLEPVGVIEEVSFVNDSKATNVDAVIRALECFNRPVVLIMGGRNKGYDFSSLFDPVRKHVRKLITIGEAGREILDALGPAPLMGGQTAADLEEAVLLAYRSAHAGDTVLLSPACASFDMFGSYAERGEAFRKLVGDLQ